MKKFLMVLFCFFSFTVYASQRAVTDEGSIVILNSDGTWEYEDSETIEKVKIKTNDFAFKKASEATFRLKSTKNGAEFWINPKKWSFVKGDGNDQKEYNFSLKGKDLYGLAVTEKVEIELEQLTQIAFENAREVAPDAKIISREYRTVNGHKVIYMKMTGTMQGIKFMYLGYYHSDSSGSTQYLVYTGANLVNLYKKEIDTFLNGFSVQ